ncbi:MAG: hypothetical protein PHT81_05320 [Endomicrobiaceae bacterium]|nr:hypothetical protein [Endomicrobiaceae bacterium]
MGKKTLYFIVSILFLTSNSYAGSIFTKFANFSKVASYGMGFATYSLEKKSAVEGLKKLETYDILWDLLGKGEEELLNGDPDAFPALKDNLLKIKLVLDKVAEVSAAVGAGNYDEALIGTVDTMVGLVNHPVVNLTWEAVKFTYESHKLVLETKAALDIERLYGIVNNDRRLMGIGGSPDAPPLIPVTSTTVDYFYEKYLITDTSTRELVKSYVKIALGEKGFPEIATSQKAWYYMLGVSEAASQDEIAELEEFKNKSRGWINSLLQDLNKQVMVNWQQTRLRQQKAEFDKFNAQFGSAFANFDGIIAYLKRKKQIEKEQSTFAAKLAELTEALKKAAEIDNRDIAFQISKISNDYAVKALIIDDVSFNTAFENLYIEAIHIVDNIDKKSVVSEIVDPYVEKPSTDSVEKGIYDLYASAISHINSMSSVLPRPPYETVKNYLSVNNYNKAYDIVSEWKKAYQSAKDSYISDNIKIRSKIVIPPNPDPKKMSDESYGKRCASGSKKAMMVIGEATTYQTQPYSRDVDKLDGMLAYFLSMKYSAERTFNAFLNSVERHIITVRLSNINSYTDYLFTPEAIGSTVPTKIQKAKEFVSQNGYVSMGKINDSGKTIRHIGSIIDNKKSQLSSQLYPVRNYILPQYELDNLKGLKESWQKVTFPEDSVIDMITNDTRTLDKFTQSVSNLKSAWNGYNPSADQSLLNELKKKLDNDILNRQTDTDFLEMLSIQWRGWTQSQKVFCAKDTDKGYIYSDGIEFEPKNYGYILASKTDAVTHYITHQEFLKNPKIVEATASLKKLKVYKFIQSNMPNMAVLVNNMLTGADYKFATDQNFYSRSIGKVVWKKELEQAQNILNSIDIKSDTYRQTMEELSKFLPATIGIPTLPKDREQTAQEKIIYLSCVFYDNISADQFQNLNLGKKYIELRSKVKPIIEERKKFVINQINEQNKKDKVEVSIQPFKTRFDGVKAKLGSVSGKKDAIFLFKNDYTILVRDYSDSKLKDDNFSKELYGLREVFIQKISGEDIKKIQDFYSEFKNAYQSKRDSKLLSMISDNWDAGDGTTLSDLEDYFRNMFTVYDTIQYELSNMKINPSQTSSFQDYIVSYDVEITGNIYDSNITRKEKSAVSEMITIDSSSDKAKITKTLSGSFWYYIK